jgi:ribonucleoside-diphosphate reductase alpha chain
VKELKTLGLWTEEMRNKIKLAEGSVQGMQEISEEVRTIYRGRMGNTDAFADRHGS